MASGSADCRASGRDRSRSVGVPLLPSTRARAPPERVRLDLKKSQPGVKNAMPDLCTKCGERAPSSGQRWCSRCRKGRTPKGNAGENAPGNGGNVTPGENAVPRVRACPNCQVLADEVAALKRQLAGRPERAPMPVMSADQSVRPAVTRWEAGPEAGPRGAAKHGPDCQCSPCWMERKGSRARRA